ncbi:MAG: leucine-rich repeat domain-containing protein [Alphaproteobacteria bacterium]|nr:leucine-rich repeat domain-containing protein [Alphaproteobacteria bacterium]
MKKFVFILAIFLSFNTFAGETTVIAQTDSNDVSTKCGDNCSWKLYSDGTLEISGQGNMYDWDFFDTTEQLWEGGNSTYQTLAPWGEYSGQISNIKIGEGITYIGDHSFYNIAATSAELPDTLIEIGPQSFQYSALENISIPNSVTTIGFASFDRTHLTSLVIPDSVTTIEDVAFRNLPLSTLIIPDSVTSIEGERVFYGVSATIYCLATLLCENRGSENIVSYEKEGGVYILDGKFYTSLENMQKDISREAEDTNDYTCGTDKNKCKRDVLEAKGICQGSECDTFIQSDGQYMLKFGGKTYQDINALLKGNYDKRRIYTIEEANFVAGDKNRVSIRYR